MLTIENEDINSFHSKAILIKENCIAFVFLQVELIL